MSSYDEAIAKTYIAPQSFTVTTSHEQIFHNPLVYLTLSYIPHMAPMMNLSENKIKSAHSEPRLFFLFEYAINVFLCYTPLKATLIQVTN